jgi:hypothetical protein
MTTTTGPATLTERLAAKIARPFHRSKTARAQRAADAAHALRRYRNALNAPGHSSAAPSTMRVTALLWVIAHAEQTLWWETGGRLGDPDARPGTVLRGLTD